MEPNMNYAVINNETNVVENTIVLNPGSTWQPPTGSYIVDISNLGVGIGWTYDSQSNTWTPPPGSTQPESEIGVTRV